ncbi:MAG TPA: pentapeptide repeat-containing protein [Steroidobacteraceae bacterium]|nr:pentapeptide repeat-containing protein [Steroidobacteraceae bacterium]
MKPTRLSYETSCRRLQENYLDGDIPSIPNHLPQHDDPEPLGVCFFRVFVGDGDNLGNLTLPRTFFGRSDINDASFRNTDFTESNLCWNDFTDVDFTDATLTRSDLRCSQFTNVSFVGADLRGADLRRSSFEQCNFGRAVLTGAIATRAQQSALALSPDQEKQIAWTDDEGTEPGGG